MILDLPFTAPVGCEFCTGKSEKGDDRPPEKLAHTNLNLTMRLPEKITGLPADALFGTKEIVFRPGERNVDVYKHLDSGRLIHTHGTIHLENGRGVLNVLLNMGDWPADVTSLIWAATHSTPRLWTTPYDYQ